MITTKKLIKLNVKAEKCMSREQAKKVLKKEKKIRQKMA